MRLFTLLFLGSTIAPSQVQILTANGNNQRSNSNLQEYQLSPVTVNAASFGKLGALSVDGQVYAQPLYMSGISMGDQGTRSVLFVATMHNSVYAFDADGFSSAAPATRYPLWQVSLDLPFPASYFSVRTAISGLRWGFWGPVSLIRLTASCWFSPIPCETAGRHIICTPSTWRPAQSG